MALLIEPLVLVELLLLAEPVVLVQLLLLVEEFLRRRGIPELRQDHQHQCFRFARTLR